MICGISEILVATKLFLDAATSSFPHGLAHYFANYFCSALQKPTNAKSPECNALGALYWVANYLLNLQ
jgi:hypothetical protein